MTERLIPGALFMLVGFGCLLGVLAIYQQHRCPHPESMRKLLHVGMGLITLALPWLFDGSAEVLVVGGAFLLLLIGIRRVPQLRRSLGPVIHGVERKSFGDLSFVFGASILFVLSSGDPLLFCIPMVTIALADAASGVVGLRYGFLRFSGSPAAKTIEGSVAFFTVAFLSTHIGLLLFTATGRAETLVIALAVAFVLTLLEAATGHGLDNALIPVGSCLLLKLCLDLVAT